jgi:hypothetical protein
MDLIDICRIFHPAAAQYTFFSATHRNFSKIGHIFTHNSNLSEYKKFELIPYILSNHNEIKLEINTKRNY